MRLRLEETAALSGRILELAMQYQRPSAYDMTYVALAERLDSPLITGDQRLLKAVSGRLKWIILLWERVGSSPTRGP